MCLSKCRSNGVYVHFVIYAVLFTCFLYACVSLNTILFQVVSNMTKQSPVCDIQKM